MIILSTIAKRVYELFKRRGCAHGFDLEDWFTAERELLQNDFNGNTSEFDLFIESPRDPEVTTILSTTTRSMIGFRSTARHTGAIDRGPDLVSVRIFREEIDTTQADVNRVDWLLHVHVFQRRTIEVQADLAAYQEPNNKDGAAFLSIWRDDLPKASGFKILYETLSRKFLQAGQSD